MTEIEDTMVAPNACAAEQTIRGLGYLLQELEHLREVYADAVEELDDLRAKAEEPREVTEDDLPEELKKRLMPEGMEWIRYSNDCPVRIGDVDSDGFEVERIVFYQRYDGIAVSIRYRNGSLCPCETFGPGERVKCRDLLGADGEPIKAGEIVYDTSDGKPLLVVSLGEGLKRNGCNVLVRDVDTGLQWRHFNTCLTHERRAKKLAGVEE